MPRLAASRKIRILASRSGRFRPWLPLHPGNGGRIASPADARRWEAERPGLVAML
jgi:hypothetical protein